MTEHTMMRASNEMTTIHTKHHGAVSYAEDDIITFPEGVAGFESLRKFVLTADDKEKPFSWLLSIEDTTVGFLLVDPCLVRPGYSDELSLPQGNHTIYCIVAVPQDIEKATVNLKGPIIIGRDTHEGHQLILNSERYPAAMALFSHHHS